eukprot:SAG31_NODE_22820_length_517_cov_0.813397_1_plen_29_part_10
MTPDELANEEAKAQKAAIEVQFTILSMLP